MGKNKNEQRIDGVISDIQYMINFGIHSGEESFALFNLYDQLAEYGHNNYLSEIDRLTYRIALLKSVLIDAPNAKKPRILRQIRILNIKLKKAKSMNGAIAASYQVVSPSEIQKRLELKQ